MESLAELHTTLRNVQDLAGKIISKGVEMMKDIADEESEIIEEISEHLNDDEISDDEIAEEVQDYLNFLIRDSETVCQDIGEFAKAVVQGDEAVYAIDSTFFQQVWDGDMYDKNHVEGLKALGTDLQDQLKLLTDDKVVDTVVFRLKDSVNVVDTHGSVHPEGVNYSSSDEE